jgi:hypothetical protein
MFVFAAALVALLVVLGGVTTAGLSGRADAAEPLICVAPQVLNATSTACVDPPTTTTVTTTPAPVRRCARDEDYDRRLDRCVRRIVRVPTTTTSRETTRAGDCTTVTTTTTEYTRSVQRWNDVAGRLHDRLTLTVAEINLLNGAFRDQARWHAEYDRARQVSRDTNTTCDTPPATVVVAPPPVTYTVPRQVYRAPVGSVNTGAW